MIIFVDANTYVVDSENVRPYDNAKFMSKLFIVYLKTNLGDAGYFGSREDYSVLNV